MLEIDEASYGRDHPYVATALSNLALFLRDTNRASEAETLFRRALNVLEITKGPDETRAAVLNNLGGLLRATNRLNEAEPLFRRAVIILLRFAAATGDEHPKLRAVIKNLLATYEASGFGGDELLEKLSGTAADAGLDRDQLVELLEWWQSG